MTPTRTSILKFTSSGDPAIDATRQEFEQWYVEQPFHLPDDPIGSMKSAHCWKGWCAALAHQAAPSAKEPTPIEQQVDGIKQGLSILTEIIFEEGTITLDAYNEIHAKFSP